MGTKRGQSGDEVGTLLYDESDSFISFAPCYTLKPGGPELCRVTAHATNFERKVPSPWEPITRRRFWMNLGSDDFELKSRSETYTGFRRVAVGLDSQVTGWSMHRPTQGVHGT